jgi:hypothetical protein
LGDQPHLLGDKRVLEPHAAITVSKSSFAADGTYAYRSYEFYLSLLWLKRYLDSDS